MVSSRETVPDEVASDKLQKRQIPDSGVHSSQSDKEGSTLSITPEKSSENGFNWRKYGQKNVKGNEFIRSYYKCTHPNCHVKKQVERSRDGQITDTLYFGNHDHPKPQPSPTLAVGFVVSIQEERPNVTSTASAEEKSSKVYGQTSHQIEPKDVLPISIVAASADDVEVTPQSNRIRDEVDKDDDTNSKRQKKDTYHVDATPVDKPTGEPRIVVQTVSEVDIVNDGYRWRKYGQKFVKGNPNPRSYYRCSNAGCPVKKHVERASHDPKLVITTYEGQHDHDMPPARTVTHNTAGPITNTMTQNGESKTKSDEGSTLGLEMVVHTIPVPESKSNKQLNSESRTKSNGSDTVGPDVVGHAGSGHQNKSSEQVNGSESRNKSEESGSHGLEMAISTSSGPDESKSNEQWNGEPRSKVEESTTVELDKVIQVSSIPEKKSKEEQKPNAEPVQT